MALLLLVLALLGMPLFAVLALGALGGYWQAGLDPLLAGLEFARIGEVSMLGSLPLFVFSGVLLVRSGTPARLVDLLRSRPGGMPGSQVLFVLIACSLMAALTGVAGMVAVAVGSLLLPGLAQSGHSRRSGLGIVTVGSSPGVLLAPSLPLILYAAVAQRVAPRSGSSIMELFLAGLLPGILLLLLITGYAAWVYRGVSPDGNPGKPLGRVLRDNALELPLAFVLLGGIYSGRLSVMEAGVVTASWLVITLVLIRREVALTKLPEVIAEAMVMVSVLLLLLGMALVSASVMIDLGLPRYLAEWLPPFIDGAPGLLLAVAGLLLAAGMFLDVGAAVVVVAPLAIPVAIALGVNPVHLGVVLVAGAQAGCCVPPLGRTVLLASRRLEHDASELRRAVLPYLVVLLLGLLVVAGWPALSLVVPSLFGA